MKKCILVRGLAIYLFQYLLMSLTILSKISLGRRSKNWIRHSLDISRVLLTGQMLYFITSIYRHGTQVLFTRWFMCFFPQSFTTMWKGWNVQIKVLIVYFFITAYVSGSGVKYYTNKWLVHVPLGEVVAREVAHINDMEYEGPVMYKNIYNIHLCIFKWT